MLTSEKPLCFFVQLGGYQTHEVDARGAADGGERVQRLLVEVDGPDVLLHHAQDALERQHEGADRR